MPPLSYTPYYPIAVAANLRFSDSNGIPVTEMYPVAVNQSLDSPTTGYISRIGSKLSDLMGTYIDVVNTLANYNTRITNLETQVAAIQASGVTFQLYVNGGCLLGNTSVTVPAAVTSLISNSCSYNAALGTTTALAGSIGALGIGTLNSLPAFSQSGSMSGLANWKSVLATTADLEYDLALAYLDSRYGITKALAAITPTCAQVIVNYQATLNSQLTFNLYFSGYTFIPTGYADAGSIVKITDTSGNIYQTSFNIVNQSTITSPLVLLTSGSTLSPTSAYYIVDVKSNVSNAALGTTCIKETFQTVYTNSGTGGISSFDIGNYTATTSGTTSIALVSGLSYTPKAVNIIPKNAFSSNLLYNQNFTAYIQYTNGGATLTLAGSSGLGTINYDWIAYR